MRMSKKGTQFLIAGIALVSMLLLSSRLTLAVTDENPDVTRLLTEAKEKAAVLSQDADQMEAFTRSNVSWESHATMLEDIKQHINDLGRVTEKLQSERNSASPWQQQAIDRMLPLMRELASNTTAAINHLREHQTQPNTGSYPEYLKTNAETAHKLSDMIASFVEYRETRAKLAQLEQKLEIARR